MIHICGGIMRHLYGGWHRCEECHAWAHWTEMIVGDNRCGRLFRLFLQHESP